MLVYLVICPRPLYEYSSDLLPLDVYPLPQVIITRNLPRTDTRFLTVDDFVSQLLLLPAEADIISDSIYSSSQTLDGRRFAEEFIRRRKLADKGIIPDPVANGSNGFGGGNSKEGGNEGKGGAGGWSEVAKKGGQNSGEGKAEAFKVVAGKRKGKR